MKVDELMMKPAATCGRETNLAHVTALMWENNTELVPVLSDGGKLAGILTDRDICIALGTRNARASDLAARDVLDARPLVCTTAGEDVRSALQIMHEERLGRLPVVDEHGKLQGLVALEDLVAALPVRMAA